MPVKAGIQLDELVIQVPGYPSLAIPAKAAIQLDELVIQVPVYPNQVIPVKAHGLLPGVAKQLAREYT